MHHSKKYGDRHMFVNNTTTWVFRRQVVQRLILPACAFFSFALISLNTNVYNVGVAEALTIRILVYSEYDTGIYASH